MANIVDDLSLQSDAQVIYFFCRHDLPESLKPRTVLGCLAHQCLNLLPPADQAFEKEPVSIDLDRLASIIGRSNGADRKAFILVDGLDECSLEDRRCILLHLSRPAVTTHWRIALSARFSVNSFLKDDFPVLRHVSVPIDNPDIDQYVDHELEARLINGKLRVEDPCIITEIRDALIQGANGMFLWVALQLDEICAEVSHHGIRSTIRSLPKDITETYVRILNRVTARDHKNYHLRILKVLAVIYKPLSMDEVREVLSVTAGDTTWDPRKLINNVLDILGFCGSLIMIDEEEQTLRFVHHTAKSFFQTKDTRSVRWSFSEEQAHSELD
ncbi:Vegetative incompatibility protein HET-E-1 [Colletotrichum spinosum]|uniref:Vegetative incompatibility protein HET-E-1 n=1 Tax=Colletotrichum spinosum TaxID=1347390 RepID=A0A4R8Q3Y8_9PEZI|nr:Vegetative incompatibility protein HET-E-1 [Colletotrichum spinosum]